MKLRNISACTFVKYRLPILVLICISTFTTKAQVGVELKTNLLYTFAETIPGYDASYRVKDGETWLGTLGLILGDVAEVNFTYQIQQTRIDERPYNSMGIATGSFNTTISYYQLGFNRLFNIPSTDKLIPFTGVRVGIGYYNFDSNKYGDVTKLALGLNLGLKYMVSPKVGINLMAQVQSPVQGIGLYVGTGGVSAGTTSYVLQFALGGGLVFKLK